MAESRPSLPRHRHLLCGYPEHDALCCREPYWGELIHERTDADSPNMGLMTWKSADKRRAVRKADVGTAKNYLAEAEIHELNLIVETFPNTAELRATRRQTMRLGDWEKCSTVFLRRTICSDCRAQGRLRQRKRSSSPTSAIRNSTNNAKLWLAIRWLGPMTSKISSALRRRRKKTRDGRVALEREVHGSQRTRSLTAKK